MFTSSSRYRKRRSRSDGRNSALATASYASRTAATRLGPSTKSAMRAGTCLCRAQQIPLVSSTTPGCTVAVGNTFRDVKRQLPFLGQSRRPPYGVRSIGHCRRTVVIDRVVTDSIHRLPALSLQRVRHIPVYLDVGSKFSNNSVCLRGTSTTSAPSTRLQRVARTAEELFWS